MYFYFNDQFSVDIFSSSAGFILVVITTLSATLILRYSPDGEGPMDFISVVSIQMYPVLFDEYSDITMQYLKKHILYRFQ